LKIVRAAQLILILLIALPASAQDVPPRFEVFGGYSMFNAAAQERHTFHGAQFNVKFNLRPTAAFMADVAGQYRSDPSYTPPEDLFFLNFHDRYLHAYQALIGPEFTRRGEKTDLFVHALGGLVHGVQRTTGENFGAIGLGGGFVFHRQKLFGLRAQVDYVPNRGGGTTYHDVRLGIGAVLRKK